VRIARIESFVLPRGWTFVRVELENGVVGWGEAGVQGFGTAVAAVVDLLAGQVIGKDVTAIESIWQLLYRARFYRGGPIHMAGVAGIDIALWDALGKTRAASVHELLGGPVRERIPAYVWAEGTDTDELILHAKERVAGGAAGVKFELADAATATSERARGDAVERVAAMRALFGRDAVVAVDCHGRASPAQARKLLADLEVHHATFVEEPVLSDLPEAYGQLVAGTSTPIAAGERVYSRWDLKPLLTSGLAYLQPDPGNAGGLTETRKMMALAEAYGMACAPHSAAGPILLAACIQLGLAVPNVILQECPAVDFPDEYQRYAPQAGEQFKLVSGCLAAPEGPGLGIVINEHAVRADVVRGESFTPPAISDDNGADAEW
jgi:galactonate dehydratase